MNIIDFIEKKKNKKALNHQEVQYIIEKYVNGDIPDYQMSALLMAIWFNGMSIEETFNFTMAMVRSGNILDLSSIHGKKIDKHSTGGVGDKTSLALLPMVAAAGVAVPKISGRGLGHTGGTIDKLDSIQGFRTDLSIAHFKNIVQKIKISIIGTQADIVPADKKIYSLRDVTGTVNSVPLIASSIMSKKIAGGADAFILNVTVGKGAFIKDIQTAIQLGETMVDIGRRNNKDTFVIISSMNQPLGYAVGNTLEIKEAINLLKGDGPEDLKQLCITLGSYMLIAGNITDNSDDSKKILQNVLDNGSAYKKFKELVYEQGGNIHQIENTDLLPTACYNHQLRSNNRGFIQGIDAYKVGKSSMLLGAGRLKKDDFIDLSVGIVVKKKKGEWVEKNDLLATVYYNDKNRFIESLNVLKTAFVIDRKKVFKDNLILGVLDKNGKFLK